MPEIEAKARQLARVVGAPAGSYDVCKEAIALEMADWMKERMMKDAVECTWGSQATSSFMSNFPNINVGDKVKIIIVKED